MKYKTGQKVLIIKNPPTYIKPNGMGFNEDMVLLCGRISTISGCINDLKLGPYYLLEENGWNWLEEWLLSPSNFREGDIVKVKSTNKECVLGMDFSFKDEEIELISRKQLL